MSRKSHYFVRQLQCECVITAPMSARLLIIAQDSRAVDIRRVAQAEGWTVYSAELGSCCLATAQRLGPDLILLDVASISDSFVELCRYFRLIKELAMTTLVTLVAREQDYNERLLDAGVDETWPENTDSIDFRIRVGALYRRYQSPKHSSVVRRGEVELDLERYTVRSTGQPANLTKSQVTVLKYLMQNAGVFVSHKELLERAWGRSDLDSDAVKACMKRLRNALAATGAFNVIRSVRGGYLFDTDVQPTRANS